MIAGEVAPGGNLKTALLDGETKNFDMERGFTRHPIDDREDRGIVVKLGMPCIINHLRLLLWDKGRLLTRAFLNSKIFPIIKILGGGVIALIGKLSNSVYMKYLNFLY